MTTERTPVLQDWVLGLPLMQQTVLLTAIRGPDGVRKEHSAKLVCRWLRRCVLISAFDKCVLDNPWDGRGGSFTGPSLGRWVREMRAEGEPAETFAAPGRQLRTTWQNAMEDVYYEYRKATDELPHHFQMHIKHCAEVLGYKHPNPIIANSWHKFYVNLVDDLHNNPETEAQMDYRLGDKRDQWLAAGIRSSEQLADPMLVREAPP